jgi:lipoprotein NlpI
MKLWGKWVLALLLVSCLLTCCDRDTSQKYAQFHFEQGLAHGRKGHMDQAVEDFDQALKLNPNFTLAYLNQGIAYYEKGNLDRAFSDYNIAIELDPQLAQA